MSNNFGHLLLLGRIAALARCNLLLQTGGAWSVTAVSPAKTAKPIEMTFELWTQVGQKKRILDGVPDPQ